MVRIRTTTTEGIVFMSPFIYTRGTGEFIINKIRRWHKKPSLELVEIPFDKKQSDCFYNQHFEIDDIMIKLPIVEKFLEV